MLRECNQSCCLFWRKGVLALLGKKDGSTRTIAIAATFYRLLMAVLKGEVRGWDADVGMEGDSALPGSSPHDAAARRRLLVEAHALVGDAVALVLWDIRKFFDSLDVEVLICRAEAAGFPLDQLVLGLQVHRAPSYLCGAMSKYFKTMSTAFWHKRSDST